MSAHPQRIAVFGAGYVGLVTGACFADLGHDVVVRDVLPERIDALRRGEVPIYEPGLRGAARAQRRAAARSRSTSHEAIDGADFVYVAVGTPPTYSGDADLSAVWTVIDELPVARPARRRRDEEHRARRHRREGASPARRTRAAARRLRLEPRVHGRGDGRPRLHAARPDRDRRLRARRTATRSRRCTAGSRRPSSAATSRRPR